MGVQARQDAEPHVSPDEKVVIVLSPRQEVKTRVKHLDKSIAQTRRQGKHEESKFKSLLTRMVSRLRR